MPIRISAAAILVPLGLLAALFLVPGLNELEAYRPTFHFYIVSAASLLAPAVAAVLIISARSVRETRSRSWRSASLASVSSSPSTA